MIRTSVPAGQGRSAIDRAAASEYWDPSVASRIFIAPGPAFPRSTSTEQGANRTTARATLPRRNCRTVVTVCEPTTMRSVPDCRAYSTIAPFAFPQSTRVAGSMPDRRSCCAAACTASSARCLRVCMRLGSSEAYNGSTTLRTSTAVLWGQGRAATTSMAKSLSAEESTARRIFIPAADLSLSVQLKAQPESRC